MIVGLDHVALAVPDIEAARETCARLFGRDATHAGTTAGAAFARFPLDNMALLLLAPDGSGPLGALVRERLDRDGPGLLRAVFRVADLDRAARLMTRRGLPPSPATTEAGIVGFDPDACHGIRYGLTATGRDTPPTATTPDAVGALDHLVLKTPDPERSIALLAGRFDLELRLDRSNPDWGARLLFFRCGDLVIEVAHDLKAGRGDGPDTLWGLSWRVGDLDAARARLVAAGFDLSAIRTGRRPGTRVCTVREGTLGVPTILLGPA